MASSSSSTWEAYRYEPSLAAAVLFCILFSLLTVLHTYHLLRTRTWPLIPFLIGGIFESTGYIGRILSSTQSPNHWTLGPYIMQTLLLLLAPALFAASIYMVLGRIILLTTDTNIEQAKRYAVVPVKYITRIFVLGDVISFLAQSGGGGYMAQGTVGAYRTGSNIVVGGLVVQIVVFGFFVVTAAVFHVRMRKRPTAKVVSGGAGAWERHMLALYMTSALILVRSVFRVVEFAQGNDGYLMSHEVFLYVFDGVLMMSVMVVWAVVHPSEVYALLKGENRRMVRGMVRIETMEMKSSEGRLGDTLA